MLKPIPEMMTVPEFEGGGVISFQEKEVPVPGTGQLLLQVGVAARIFGPHILFCRRLEWILLCANLHPLNGICRVVRGPESSM